MTYEEFEDRHGAETTGDRRAVWNAGVEEGRRQLEAELAKHKEARALAEALVISHEGKIETLGKELAECRRKFERFISADREVEQILGMALYGKGEDGLPLWGEHTAETLAEEAARKLGQNPPDDGTPDPPLKPTKKLRASPIT